MNLVKKIDRMPFIHFIDVGINGKKTKIIGIFTRPQKLAPKIVPQLISLSKRL